MSDGTTLEETLGGIYVQLKLHNDLESFKQGQQQVNKFSGSIKKLGHSLKKLATFATGATAGILTYSSVISKLDFKNVMLARSLRMATSEVVAWKNTAELAGGSGDDLANTLLELQKKSDRLKLGEVDVGLAKSLGLMNIGYQQFLNADSAGKMRMVMSQAMKMPDKGFAGELVRDALGTGGKEMFQYLQMSGKSLDEVLDKSKAIMFTNDETKRKTALFNIELKTTKVLVGEMGSLFVSGLAEGLMPMLQGFQKWAIENKKVIGTNIVKFGKDVATILGSIAKVSLIVASAVARVSDKFGGFVPILVSAYAVIKGLKFFNFVEGIVASERALKGFEAILSKTFVGAAWVGALLIAVEGFKMLKDNMAFSRGLPSKLGEDFFGQKGNKEYVQGSQQARLSAYKKARESGLNEKEAQEVGWEALGQFQMHYVNKNLSKQQKKSLAFMNFDFVDPEKQEKDYTNRLAQADLNTKALQSLNKYGYNYMEMSSIFDRKPSIQIDKGGKFGTTQDRFIYLNQTITLSDYLKQVEKTTKIPVNR